MKLLLGYLAITYTIGVWRELRSLLDTEYLVSLKEEDKTFTLAYSAIIVTFVLSPIALPFDLCCLIKEKLDDLS